MVGPVVDRIRLCGVKAAAHVNVLVGSEGSCRCPGPVVDGGRAREGERRIVEPGAVPESCRPADGPRGEVLQRLVGPRVAALQRVDANEPELPGGGTGRGSRCRALVLFAGEARCGSLAHALRMARWEVDDVDILIGGRAHDLAVEGTQEAVCRAVQHGEYELVWLGVPCSSFSVLHLSAERPLLRSRDQPRTGSRYRRSGVGTCGSITGLSGLRSVSRWPLGRRG